MQFAPNFVTRKRFAQGLWGLLGSGAARQTHGARARTQGEGTRATLRSLSLAGLGAGLLALVPLSAARAEYVVPSECYLDPGPIWYLDSTYVSDINLSQAYVGQSGECAGLLVVDHIALTETANWQGDNSYRFYKDGKYYYYDDFYVANITDMFALFFDTGTGTQNFNQDISGWNTGNVENMDSLFYRNSVFNRDLSQWDVSSVTNMKTAFAEAASFNQDIGDWNVSNVQNFDSMFL